jgi:hypothetical protein
MANVWPIPTCVPIRHYIDLKTDLAVLQEVAGSIPVQYNYLYKHIDA